jgi:hypothetical protein
LLLLPPFFPRHAAVSAWVRLFCAWFVLDGGKFWKRVYFFIPRIFFVALPLASFADMIVDNDELTRPETKRAAVARTGHRKKGKGNNYNILQLCQMLDPILEPVAAAGSLDLTAGSKRVSQTLQKDTKGTDIWTRVGVCIGSTTWDRAWSIWRAWRADPAWIKGFKGGVSACAVQATKRLKRPSSKTKGKEPETKSDADAEAERKDAEETASFEGMDHCQWLQSALLELPSAEDGKKDKKDKKDKQGGMHPEDVRILLRILTQRQSCPTTMALACRLVAHVTDGGQVQNWIQLVEGQGIALVLRALNRHANDEQVALHACAALASQATLDIAAPDHPVPAAVQLSVSAHSAVLIGKLGGVSEVMRVLTSSLGLSSSRVALAALRALSGLAESDENRVEMMTTAHQNGVQVVLGLLGMLFGGQNEDADASELATWACRTLALLLGPTEGLESGTVAQLALQHNAVPLLLLVAAAAKEHDELLYQVLWALAALVDQGGREAVQQIPSQKHLDDFLEAIDGLEDTDADDVRAARQQLLSAVSKHSRQEDDEVAGEISMALASNGVADEDDDVEMAEA